MYYPIWIGVAFGYLIFGPLGIIGGFFFGKFIGKLTAELNPTIKFLGKSIDISFAYIILAAYIIRSSTVNEAISYKFIYKHLVTEFGLKKANKRIRELKSLLKTEISIEDVCMKINDKMTHNQRLVLLFALFDVIYLNHYDVFPENEQLLEVSYMLEINNKEFSKIKILYKNKRKEKYRKQQKTIVNQENSVLQNAYLILGLNYNCDNDSIKSTYKKLAKIHHPDKVHKLGKFYVKKAEEKFQQINNAYEIIKKHRNFK